MTTLRARWPVLAIADVTNTVAASVYALTVGGTGNGSSRPAGLTDAALQAMLSVDAGNVIDNTQHRPARSTWTFRLRHHRPSTSSPTARR